MKVIPIPFSHVDPRVNIATTDGTCFAPKAIRDLYTLWESKGVHFLNENFKPASLEFPDWLYDVIYRKDFGLINFIPQLWGNKDINPKTLLAGWARHAFREANGKRVAFLGGDHSISYGLFKEFRACYGEDAVLVVLDAHPDLCAKGNAEPLHSDWLNFVISHDGFDPKRVYGIGWRDAEQAEIDFAQAHHITRFSMDEIRKYGDIKNFMESFKFELKVQNFSNAKIYLSIDCDVFDPSLVPAVTTPSPGGLNTYDAVTLIRELARLPNLKALDIVEIDPARDINDFSKLFVLKILREMALEKVPNDPTPPKNSRWH